VTALFVTVWIVFWAIFLWFCFQAEPVVLGWSALGRRWE
jgi:hypothetical protein